MMHLTRILTKIRPVVELEGTMHNSVVCMFEGVDFSCFVGDLAPDVTDYVLQEHFRAQYPSVRSAKASYSIGVTLCDLRFASILF